MDMWWCTERNCWLLHLGTHHQLSYDIWGGKEKRGRGKRERERKERKRKRGRREGESREIGKRRRKGGRERGREGSRQNGGRIRKEGEKRREGGEGGKERRWVFLKLYVCPSPYIYSHVSPSATYPRDCM